ncbi:hypothetical protein [Clavibacter michiganensis]|uniref:hypothetical protein n=2 Tax=Clavibacter michiganensis TaxID=28447 RepID=UPI0014304370|nr:hypothetical protein [Clavibacter michiganensis]MDO4144122.1 hypothetical protein [Clavibacter michiganensis]QIT13038.1 hypothetical protein GRD74_15750 [Clavibacter michiganensis subsp. michiganensis]QIT16219.1 hypothetical protein GRD61_16060 [Clavibacter michiganensis subsp. michiganensis]
MTDEKLERPTLPTRRTPRPAPDLGRDPIDVPTPPTATTVPPQEPDVRPVPAPQTVQLPKRDVTVQMGTRIGVRTKDLLDYVKATQNQDIRVSIERAVEAMYGHLLPRDEASS